MLEWSYENLTDEQKAELNRRQRELGQQYDPETGQRKKVETTDSGDSDDIGARERKGPEHNRDDDEDIR